MKNKRRTLGWLGFVAACYWLWADYQAAKYPQKITTAIYSGWTTILLTLAHIWA